jgi:hypothetical protein
VGAGAGPFDACLDADLLTRYAAATKDPSPLVQRGLVVPAVAAVLCIWSAQSAGRMAAVPLEIQHGASGGVHGEHEVLLHRPIEVGEPLQVSVRGYGSRPAGRNSLTTLHYLLRGAGGDLVAEQWWTTVYLGVVCERNGAAPPDHAFPEASRSSPLGVWGADVDEGMARRYAEVSGDWSTHHFDLDVARASGFDRLFVHGLCTMALCAQGVVALAAGGDPSRVRRVAVRFATPVFLGERLKVCVYDAGPLGYAFEAFSAGAQVISQGRAELF